MRFIVQPKVILYCMKVKVSTLRKTIRKALAGSDPNEAYGMISVDDPIFDKESKFVPKKRKEEVKKFLDDIGLTKR